MCVNLAIGANTPPLGVDLITACKVAGIPYEASFRYIYFFIAAMIVSLVLLIAFPPLATYIPNLLMK
jgi:TRAP-type C4-dicarboxylate transport system permease large subunit